MGLLWPELLNITHVIYDARIVAYKRRVFRVQVTLFSHLTYSKDTVTVSLLAHQGEREREGETDGNS